MSKFLLAGAAVVFAGIGATFAVASEHKAPRRAESFVTSKDPMRAAVLTPARHAISHKHHAPRHRHARPMKRHHSRRTHSK